MLHKLTGGRGDNQLSYLAIDPVNNNNDQPSKIALVAQQFAGSQQLSEWTQGPLNRRKFMPGIINLAKNLWLER